MTTPVVVFVLGDDRYAVEALLVREVVANPRPTELPTAPSALLGVFNLRGELVPLFDTALLLGIGQNPADSVAVVVNTTAGVAALAAGDLPTYVELDREVGPSHLRGTTGVYNVGEAVVVLLDVDALLIGHGRGAAGAMVGEAGAMVGASDNS